MIIYGTRASLIKSVQLVNEVCPNCQQKGTLLMSVYSKQAHVFWIPTFPIGKTGVSTCANCLQNVQQKEMTPVIRDHYKQVASTASVPLWAWSGLAIIFALIGWGFYSEITQDQNEKIYIKQPAVGDIYSYKTEDGVYSMMKVVAVSADSVSIQYNSYETDQMSGVYQLKEKPFVDMSFAYPRVDMEEMYRSGKIFKIERE